MRKALTFGLTGLAFVAGAVPAAAGSPGGTPARDDQSSVARREPQAIDRALKRALAKKAWDDLRLDVECTTKDGPGSVTVYGNGVGIWNGRRQFALDRERVPDLLRALLRAGFAGMQDTYGGKEDPRRPDATLKVVCSVALAMGGATKRAIQLEGGTQSLRLERLGREILDLCEEPARSGVTAASVSDGLRKVAAGDLAPETLSVTLHRKVEGPAGPGVEGFLLRVAGRRVETRTYNKAEGYSEPVVLELQAEDLGGLARALAEADPDTLPGNLYAEHYTDLTIEVLGQRASVQARRFDGMQPATHGEKQVAFDRAFERLRQLHARVRQAGKPGEAATH